MIDFERNWHAFWQNDPYAEKLGEVFTRPDIVDLILDLAGYQEERRQRLSAIKVLEPACGNGAFISRILHRLIKSELGYSGSIDWDNPEFDTAITAIDINPTALDNSGKIILSGLMAAGCSSNRAEELRDRWLVRTDFLLKDWQNKFDLVVGNPPYVRIEELSKGLMNTYRELYETARERADLYIPFFEKGLSLLTENGSLAFICANRFTKNKYGERLRKLISSRYHVRYYINLEHTQPFENDVNAYPAIVVIDRRQGQATLAGKLDNLDESTLVQVTAEARSETKSGSLLIKFNRWYPGSSPWVATSQEHFDFISRLNDSFPTLPESGSGTQVSIGVATGADQVFIVKGPPEDIEFDRLIPLAIRNNLDNQGIHWDQTYLINPFAADGSLVSLSQYPLLDAYLKNHRTELTRRHVAQKSEKNWYRTIDRIWPELQYQAKLLIPDIQTGPTVVAYDPGQYYPHHNLYWISSKSWDLLALKTILRSKMVRLQVMAYSVQMRGGGIRFQAQTLRKIRVPAWESIHPTVVRSLSELSNKEDQEEIDRLVSQIYQIER